MIHVLTARYRRNGKNLTVEFSRDPSRGIHWSADLWIETADGPTWGGRITDFNTDLDTVVAAAGRYMEDHHPYTE